MEARTKSKVARMIPPVLFKDIRSFGLKKESLWLPSSLGK
jgi:hypothetical protein